MLIGHVLPTATIAVEDDRIGIFKDVRIPRPVLLEVNEASTTSPICSLSCFARRRQPARCHAPHSHGFALRGRQSSSCPSLDAFGCDLSPRRKAVRAREKQRAAEGGFHRSGKCLGHGLSAITCLPEEKQNPPTWRSPRLGVPGDSPVHRKVLGTYRRKVTFRLQPTRCREAGSPERQPQHRFGVVPHDGGKIRPLP